LKGSGAVSVVRDGMEFSLCLEKRASSLKQTIKNHQIKKEVAIFIIIIL
jgi:ribosomal protein L24E